MERAMALMRAVSDAQSFARLCEKLEQSPNPAIRVLAHWMEADAERRDRNTPQALDDMAAARGG